MRAIITAAALATASFAFVPASHAEVSLSQIRSGRIDDGVRRGQASLGCVRRFETDVGWVHPVQGYMRAHRVVVVM